MMHHCETTVILRDFSSTDNSDEWGVSETHLENFLHFVHSYELRFYANGNCEKNKDYVSIICREVFEEPWMQSSFTMEDEVHYFFSIVDVYGNKRFTQSIVYISDKSTPQESRKSSKCNYFFGLERYLKRETLLNDPAELLPGDCLTISAEIDFLCFSFIQGFTFVLNLGHYPEELELDAVHGSIKRSLLNQFSFYIGKCGRLCIPLDTFYGRELCQLSGFFQRASLTSLDNRTTREVHIPDEEIVSFFNLCNILLVPMKNLVVNSIEDICQVYVIADKYDFQSGIEVCRQIIKAFLCITGDLKSRELVTQSVTHIIKLADEYRDSDLKNTINTYQEIIESFGANDYAFGKYLKERIFSDWKFVSSEHGNQFRFSRFTKSKFDIFV